MARKISDLLTAETGITIVFENAIVPKWKGSQISFKNVYISRRPHPTSSEVQRRVFSHHAPTRFEVGHHTAFHDGEDDDISVPEISEEPTEYAIFDLNVDSIDVTLSLWRWLDGKGFIEDAEIKGVRGILGSSMIRSAIQAFMAFCRPSQRTARLVT